MKLLFASVLVTLVSWACAECIRQPVFEIWEALEASALICDGDAGGSGFEVDTESLTHKVVGGGIPDRVEGLPPSLVPRTIRLQIVRKPWGSIDRAASFIVADGQTYKYGGGRWQRRKFKELFNVLQALVYAQEIGNCPVDSKGQVFPQLASVRVSLQTLAASFGIDYCLDAQFRRIGL